MPFCTCLMSSREECRRLESLLRSREQGPVECRYEEGFLEPL